MLKILQARLQQYVNHEIPDVQAGFRKGRGTRDQIANIHWHKEDRYHCSQGGFLTLLFGVPTVGRSPLGTFLSAFWSMGRKQRKGGEGRAVSGQRGREKKQRKL